MSIATRDIINNAQDMRLTLCMQQNEKLYSDAFGVEYAEKGRRLVNCENKSLINYHIGKGTQCIDDSAFEDCDHLCQLSLPNTIVRIGDWAFNRCVALQSMEIPASVTSIGDRAFNNCPSLRKITMSGIVKSIGKYAFLSCGALRTIEIPKGTTSRYKSMLPSCYWSLLKEAVLA